MFVGPAARRDASAVLNLRGAYPQVSINAMRYEDRILSKNAKACYLQQVGALGAVRRLHLVDEVFDCVV